ncbi:hypothetical protein ACFY4C_41180 [Actinomadura viridis]|uniref:hypothetical protein n=1 Tax=Actinomadura viridis TaxID=58110 RepID=UPI0036B71E9B
MAELEKREQDGGELVEVATYNRVVAELAMAGARLARLGESVRSTYRYVEGCASGTLRLADQMAGLAVDADTVAEHRDAAGVMRAVLESAEAMAAAAEDLAGLFTHTAEAHRADYGLVADAAQSMTVPMADAAFYSNR